MLDTRDIDHIVFDVAATHLPGGRLKRVLVEPYMNSIDEEGLWITLVVGEADPIVDDGAAIADVMLDVADRLVEAGDPRTSVVNFTTEDELAHSGDPDT